MGKRSSSGAKRFTQKQNIANNNDTVSPLALLMQCRIQRLQFLDAGSVSTYVLYGGKSFISAKNINCVGFNLATGSTQYLINYYQHHQNWRCEVYHLQQFEQTHTIVVVALSVQ